MSDKKLSWVEFSRLAVNLRDSMARFAGAERSGNFKLVKQEFSAISDGIDKFIDATIFMEKNLREKVNYLSLEKITIGTLMSVFIVVSQQLDDDLWPYWTTLFVRIGAISEKFAQEEVALN